MENLITAVCEHKDGYLSATIWKVQTTKDGEPFTYFEVNFSFGAAGPILRLHESDLSCLETVLLRVTHDIDRWNEQLDSVALSTPQDGSL